MRRVKNRASWIRIGVQLGVSLLILGLLFRDTQFSNPGQIFTALSIPWLALAVLVKTSALLVHEYRLWLALPRPRPPVRRVISIGVAAGVLNLVLPARGGDVAAIACLKRECNIAPSVATTAVAVTSFLEAALFGFFLIGVLSVGAAHWAELFGEDARHLAVFWISASVGLGCLSLVLLAAFASRWTPQSTHPLLGFIANTFTETARVLRDARYLGVQVVAAVIQVALVVTAFALAVPAAGATAADPIMAASIVLGISSFAAFILPPTMAAGPAAASALVLPQFGETPETALAYAATYWFVAHLPAMSMGLPCLWARMEMAAEE